ncbi:hypothetical protein ACFVAD_20495 [Sutcliffiella sp. NPDC057660]|uniref:hypothetical protein n=1 Tax=Sutcliffiella sp. NPDC057660 TaxID=3346199 RepID=UPI0036CA1729
MATLIAQKNRATAAINGEVSSDGLSAMLGEEGDLQSMLIESVKKGNKVLKGSTEDWVSKHSDRAREILSGIGKKKKALKQQSIQEQFVNWMDNQIKVEATMNVMKRQSRTIAENIKRGVIPGFSVKKEVLEVDLALAFGMNVVEDGAILAHLTEPQREHEQVQVTLLEVTEVKSKALRKKAPIDGQLAFELF